MRKHVGNNASGSDGLRRGRVRLGVGAARGVGRLRASPREHRLRTPGRGPPREPLAAKPAHDVRRPNRALIRRDLGDAGLPGLRGPQDAAVPMGLPVVRAFHRRLRRHPPHARRTVLDARILDLGRRAGADGGRLRRDGRRPTVAGTQGARDRPLRRGLRRERSSAWKRARKRSDGRTSSWQGG